MQIAILTFSVIGAASGVASLVIMARTAKKLDETGQRVKTDVDGLKTKVNKNAAVLKAALGQMEF